MKITTSYLRKVIKEELSRLSENVDKRVISWGSLINAYKQAGEKDNAEITQDHMQSYRKTPEDILYVINGNKIYHTYNPDGVKQWYHDVGPKVASLL